MRTRTTPGVERLMPSSRSVIITGWRILISGRTVIISSWDTTTKGWGVIVRSHACYFARGRTCCFAPGRIFCFGWGRTRCTASRGSQYEAHSKNRGHVRKLAQQGRNGGEPPGRVWISPTPMEPVSGLVGELGGQNLQESTKMLPTPRSSIT